MICLVINVYEKKLFITVDSKMDHLSTANYVKFHFGNTLGKLLFMKED